MAQTKGHIAALCAARWHPSDRNVCLTGSTDGTVRLWDINTCDKKQVHHAGGFCRNLTSRVRER